MGPFPMGRPAGGGAEADVFADLRAQVLRVQPAHLGMRPDSASPIFGVVMETGYRGGSAAFVCLADGTVSLYTSTGGGVIGAGEHEAVRGACLEMLSWTNQYAREFIEACTAVAEYPLPESGDVFFYLLTTDGVHLAKCTEAALVADQDPFSNLFRSCHMVLTVMRETTEGHRGNG